MTSAKIIEDSIYDGVRLTTMEVTFHRFVLAEFNTHRMFSRNSASSRAIPVEKQLEKVLENPAWPIEWPCEQPGMQGGTELIGSELKEAQLLFERIRDYTLSEINAYLPGRTKEIRLHKSLINRLLEPFMWQTVVVSSTEWDNFFEQRCSPLAQPEIRQAAELMQIQYNSSTPVEAHLNYWHLPYISESDRELYNEFALTAMSTARCARVSTLNQGDTAPDSVKDLALYAKLVSADPPHWSPLEHVAQASSSKSNKGNFEYPWCQLRHNVKVK